MFCGHIYFIVSKVNATIIDVEMFTEKQNNGDLEFKGSSLTTYVVLLEKKKTYHVGQNFEIAFL